VRTLDLLDDLGHPKYPEPKAFILVAKFTHVIPMASLARLQMVMTYTIFLVFAVLFAFLAVLTYIFQINILIAVGLAAIFIFIEYAIGPVLVEASTRPVAVSRQESPWLHDTVKSMSEKAGIPMPRIAIVENSTPNAFVYGRTSSDATLALHRGLVDQLNKDEVVGVIGHELGHIKHRDFVIMTMLSAVPIMAYLVARLSFQSFAFAPKARRKNEGGIGIAILAAAGVSFVVYLLSQLLVLSLSRAREHYSDAFSAYMTGKPRDLESALTRITYGLSLARSEPHGARAFFIQDPSRAKLEMAEISEKKEQYDLDRDGVLDERELQLAMREEARSSWKSVNALFSTHPPTFKRILLLRQMETEIEKGQLAASDIYKRI